jgi:hypothetical protein
MKSLVNPYDCLYNYADNGASKPNSIFAEIYEIICSFANEEYVTDWQSLKNQFKFYQHTYIINGCILWEIKLKKLYQNGKSKYKSFQEFCQAELNLCVWQANRIINAARVGIVLIHNGFSVIPTNESQCRELSKYDPIDIIFYWNKILEKYQNNEEKITAARIWATIQEVKLLNNETVKPPKWKRIKILHSLWEFLLKEALEISLSVEEYIQYLVGFGKYNDYSTA